MTEAQQRRFYFPAWNACAAANGWVMVRGRLNADLNTQLSTINNSWPEPAREAGLRVLALAGHAAAAEHRAVTAADLRHGCNVVAAGLPSVKSFRTRRHANQFARLCDLLRDPLNLAAIAAWLDPDEDDRRRAVKYLGTLAEAAKLRAMSRNAWGVPDWETLPLARLDSLLAEIRQGAWTNYHRNNPKPAPAPAAEMENDPF